jgi:hypothetical protein
MGWPGHVRHHDVDRRWVPRGDAAALVEVRGDRQDQRVGHRREVFERRAADRGVDGVAAVRHGGGHDEPLSGVGEVPIGELATVEEPLAQGAGEHGQDDVVHVGAGGVGDGLDPIERQVAQGDRPLGGDGLVEREVRRGQRHGERLDGCPQPQRGLDELDRQGGVLERTSERVEGGAQRHRCRVPGTGITDRSPSTPPPTTRRSSSPANCMTTVTEYTRLYAVGKAEG